MRFRCAICDKEFQPVSIENVPLLRAYRFHLEHCGYSRYHEMKAVEANTVIEVVVFAEEAKRLRREPENPPPTVLKRPPVPEVIEALEKALQLARGGVTQAVVIFETTTERQVITKHEGEWPPGDVMLAIELWRAQEVERYLRAAGRL